MDPLTEENHKEKIESMSLDAWKPLLGLIPVIEEAETFGTPGSLSETDDDTFSYHPSKQSRVIHDFLDAVYQIPVIIDFAWANWDEGRKLAGNPDTDYDSVDIPTKCKLITAFVRNDRFCDGVLLERFEDGTILQILKSIRRQIHQTGKGD